MVILLKNYLKETLNEYYVDFIKYMKILKKKIKKIYRLLRFNWKNPKTKIGAKVRYIINNIYNTFFNCFLIIKNNLLNEKNRKKNLITIGFLLMFLLTALIFLPSYAIYQNNYSFLLFNNIVGDSYEKNFDANLLIYIKDQNDCCKYNLVNEIPKYGYKYEKYKCENDSTLNYNEELKKLSFNSIEKDTCRIYFDLIKEPDVSINVMLETDIDSNNYVHSKNIPVYGYMYSHYECQNNSIINYDSNIHIINMEAEIEDTCTLYFKKESNDIAIDIYINDKLEETIPGNQKYILNNSKSECYKNNEKVNAIINYNNGYIVINNESVDYCKIYLDITYE